MDVTSLDERVLKNKRHGYLRGASPDEHCTGAGMNPRCPDEGIIVDPESPCDNVPLAYCEKHRGVEGCLFSKEELLRQKRNSHA